MAKEMILKGLILVLAVAASTLTLVELQLLFPKYALVKTYFNELMLSNVLATLGGLAITTRLVLNVVKIEENFWVKKILSFFIWKVSACFIGMFGFSIGMAISCAIHGSYESIISYLVLGLFGLIYASATMFLNIKLQVRGYLT